MNQRAGCASCPTTSCCLAIHHFQSMSISLKSHGIGQTSLFTQTSKPTWIFWKLFSLKVLWTYHFLFKTSLRGDDKHRMCHPFEYLSHKIMVNPPLACLNNMHAKPRDTTTTIGFTHPSMLGKWHGAQFFTWSFQTFQSWPSKIKALDDNITLISKITFSHVTSNVVGIVCWKYT